MNRKTFLKALAAATCLAGFGTGLASAEPLKIAVANFGDHPQLNAVVEGFKQELESAGYKDGAEVAITVDHVNFDATLVPQMISKIEAQKPALILTTEVGCKKDLIVLTLHTLSFHKSLYYNSVGSNCSYQVRTRWPVCHQNFLQVGAIRTRPLGTTRQIHYFITD